MIAWRPENGTRLGVMPDWAPPMTSAGSRSRRATSSTSGTCGSTATASSCRGVGSPRWTSASGRSSEGGGHRDHRRPAARYWIDLDAGTAGWEPIDDVILGEMCRVNDDRIGVRTDCLYMSAFTREGAIAGRLRHDREVRHRRRTPAPAGTPGTTGHVGENVFAPDPDGSAEDDGWIINSIHDDADGGQSSIVVLDARDLAAGPVARVLIPQRMPFGFHANWFPATGR